MDQAHKTSLNPTLRDSRETQCYDCDAKGFRLFPEAQCPLHSNGVFLGGCKPVDMAALVGDLLITSHKSCGFPERFIALLVHGEYLLRKRTGIAVELSGGEMC